MKNLESISKKPPKPNGTLRKKTEGFVDIYFKKSQTNSFYLGFCPKSSAHYLLTFTTVRRDRILEKEKKEQI